MTSERKKILVVEDEFITSADLVDNLELMGFTVPATTDTGEEVIDLVRQHSPDLILMDINLKGEMTGIEVAGIIKDEFDIPIIFLTGQSDEATISSAIESEPFGYIIKPFDERNLKTTIAMALYKFSIEHRLKISEMRYRTIAESADNLIAILNQDTTFEYINKSGLALLRKTSPEIIGVSFSDVISTPLNDEIEQYIHTICKIDENRHVQGPIFVKKQEIWIDGTLIPLNKDGSSTCQVLWIAHDITSSVYLHKKLQKDGIIQIEKNMEQFQILNDEIRNPLSLISAHVSIDEPPSGPQILDAVKKIDDLVTQLDKGWIESNKVRSFLLRHYQHGKDL